MGTSDNEPVVAIETKVKGKKVALIGETVEEYLTVLPHHQLGSWVWDTHHCAAYTKQGGGIYLAQALLAGLNGKRGAESADHHAVECFGLRQFPDHSAGNCTGALRVATRLFRGQLPPERWPRWIGDRCLCRSDITVLAEPERFPVVADEVLSSLQPGDQLFLSSHEPRGQLERLKGCAAQNATVLITAVDWFLQESGARYSTWDDLATAAFSDLDRTLGEATEPLLIVMHRDRDGCLIYWRDRQGTERHVLWSSPYPFATVRQGFVTGLSDVILAVLINQVCDGTTGFSFVAAGKNAWHHAQRCSTRGYGSPDTMQPLSKVLQSVHEEIVEEDSRPVSIELTGSPTSLLGAALQPPAANGQEDTEQEIARLACAVLTMGPGALESGTWSGARHFPILRIGALVAIHREEVGALAYLSKLFSDYAGRDAVPRPLCLAVFGQPGSGKSFAVKQIGKTLAVDSEIVEFRVSEMICKEDLCRALARVQSVGLEGRLPVVFWDEFDSKYEGDSFGWLRYFLAPMQDRQFEVAGATYDVGRAVFVFAGGVARSTESFLKLAAEEEERKGPDFLSRLHFCWDVPPFSIAPDETPAEPAVTLSVLVRRALVFRGLLRVHAPFVRTVRGEVVNRLLFNYYQHKTPRELERVLLASTLLGKTDFLPTDLPPAAQAAASEASPSLSLNLDSGEITNVDIVPD